VTRQRDAERCAVKGATSGKCLGQPSSGVPIQDRGTASLLETRLPYANRTRSCSRRIASISCCEWLQALISSCANRAMPFWASRCCAELAEPRAKPRSQLLLLAAARRKA
jgi:hypothetical protein